MLTSSDIIAIVAIVLSAIVSVTSAVISYKNNKANIQAKRSEIALEKRLVAFSGIVKEIGGITAWTGEMLANDINSGEEFFKYLETEKYNIHFLETYLEQRVFFPKHIDKEISEFIDLITRFVKEVILPFEKSDLIFNKLKIEDFHKSIKDKESKIVGMIQDFVGLK